MVAEPHRSLHTVRSREMIAPVHRSLDGGGAMTWWELLLLVLGVFASIGVTAIGAYVSKCLTDKVFFPKSVKADLTSDA
jgi:hypothetical protein